MSFQNGEAAYSIDASGDTDMEDPADGSSHGDSLSNAAAEVEAPLSPSVLEELTNLTSNKQRFNVRGYPMKVHDVDKWFYTNTFKPSKLIVPEHYYQRDKSSGWTSDQKGKYIRTVFAGQAATPFVINIKRTEARVIDGGHRIHTLLEFKKNQVYMLVGDQRVYYRQLNEGEKEHFDDQDLQMLEYKQLPLKDEINQYIMLNSGLPFSLGEKLASVHQVNNIVKTAYRLIHFKADRTMVIVNQMCSVLKRDSATHKGRKNELLIATFCAYNLFFRLKSLMAQPRDDAKPMFTTIAEQFVQVHPLRTFDAHIESLHSLSCVMLC